VVIFDCFTGRSIVLQPELQVAHVMHTCDSLPPTQQGVQPYSYLITRLLNVKPQPNVSVEDLGLKEVAGITAHGLRSTSFGADKDGEWAGRPTGALERWMSDDLAATVLYIHSDFKAQVRTESRLANIKKGEPDASLFEIPLGYKVMLTQGTPELGIKERPL
jgi:hypothetical protein